MRRWVLMGLMVATLAMGGCGGGYVGVYATTPPPPLPVETYGPVPGPGFIWINGYWGWSGGAYTWIPGRWERPPHGRHHWEAGRWEHRGNHYRWREGRWR